MPYGVDLDASCGRRAVKREELQKAANVVGVDVRADDQVEPTSGLCKLRQVRRNEVLVGAREASINEDVGAAGVNKECIAVLGRVDLQSQHARG